MSKPYRFFCPFLCLFLLFQVGCSSKEKSSKLVPAKGSVTLDGESLFRAKIEFEPIGSAEAIRYWGFSDEQGNFEIQSTRGKGAPAGEYKVTITKRVAPDGSEFPANSKVPPTDFNSRQVLPARYSDRTQTELRATIPKDGTSSLKFTLKKAG